MSSLNKQGHGYKTEIVVTEVTPILDNNENDENDEFAFINNNSGRWKSGLFSCCQYGCFHPALLCAWFFPTVLMGQLLTRMKLTWAGDRPTPPSEEYKKTFRTVVTIWICYILICSLFFCPQTLPTMTDTRIGDIVVVVFDKDNDDNDDNNNNCPIWKEMFLNMLTTLFGLYTLIVLIRLRMTIRTRYNIPEDMCIGCEDCCCIFFCGCLSSVQMAHQTTNYEEVPAIWCNSTGLPPTAYNYNEDDDDGNDGNNKTILTKAVIV